MGSSPGLPTAGQPGPLRPDEFKTASIPRQTSFRLKDVTPPSPLYIRRDDVLRVQAVNAFAGITLFVAYRFLRADDLTVTHGTLQFVPTSSRTLSSFNVTLGEGYLLSIVIGDTGSAERRGQTFASANLLLSAGAGQFSSQALFADYLVNGVVLGWPGAQQRQSVEGPGMWRSITGTTPAAGAEISETVPTGARWLLHAIRFSLTTSVTVANREPSLNFDDGVNTFYRGVAGFSQPASSTHGYSWGLGSVSSDGTVLNEHTRGIPNVILGQGYRFRTNTGNLQVGDAYTAPQYEVEEWMEL